MRLLINTLTEMGSILEKPVHWIKYLREDLNISLSEAKAVCDYVRAHLPNASYIVLMIDTNHNPSLKFLEENFKIQNGSSTMVNLVIDQKPVYVAPEPEPCNDPVEDHIRERANNLLTGVSIDLIRTGAFKEAIDVLKILVNRSRLG